MTGFPTLDCALPIPTNTHVVLGHGSGGRLSADLMRDIFLPAFGNDALNRLDDQASLEMVSGRIAFSTDSFVVKPLFFPGGNIGELAIYGTVNDLAVGGAEPRYLSASFILEEGLPLETLREIVNAMSAAAKRAGVLIVTGDTKVVEKGSGDQVFINTSGIGVIPADITLSASLVEPGDHILLSGPIGEHGITILSQREGLEIDGELKSDAAPLHTLAQAILKAAPHTRCMRDLTRGGLSSALNEISASAKVGMEIRESAIPVLDTVRGACEIFGLDPLYVANEGKLIAIVPASQSEAALAAMRAVDIAEQSSEIGVVTEAHAGLVTMRTALGAMRVVDMLAGDQLPRIC
ncbi:MAG TPA: hydrogenase expression/formation protein HypE [Acidisarcina sp.]|nr:hydrogenase expression/formation protein HypE [Acidisarcina sp.]